MPNIWGLHLHLEYSCETLLKTLREQSKCERQLFQTRGPSSGTWCRRRHRRFFPTGSFQSDRVRGLKTFQLAHLPAFHSWRRWYRAIAETRFLRFAFWFRYPRGYLERVVDELWPSGTFSIWMQNHCVWWANKAMCLIKVKEATCHHQFSFSKIFN